MTVGFKRRSEFGVPFLIVKGYSWDSNGVILNIRNPGLRSVIYEPEAFNRTFSSIEDLIGMPIDHLKIESKLRWTREMQEASFSAWLHKSMRFAIDHLTGDNWRGKIVGRPITSTAKSLNLKVNDFANAMGIGDIEPSGMWERGVKYPNRENIIHNPYSLPLNLGDNLGATEGWEFRDMQNRYEEIA